MLSLVYVSAATHPFTPDELDGLLQTSRANNSRLGLSGMLLYRDGDFLQVLEGQEDAVRATYERISRDPRHRRIMVLDESEVGERSFAEWSMGFRRLSGDDHPEGFVDFFSRRQSVADIVDSRTEAYRVLTSFREIA